MKKFIKFVAIVLLAAGMTGCEKKSEPENSVIPITNFDYISYGCGANYAEIQADTVYVINSEQKFAQYFSCEADPQIDFSKNTLLIASGMVSGDVGQTNCKLIKNGSSHILNVDIIMCFTASMVPTRWTAALIVNKLNKNDIVLNINIIK